MMPIDERSSETVRFTPTINVGVPMQEVINDPIKLLQAVIKDQVEDGHTFESYDRMLVTSEVRRQFELVPLQPRFRR
jgi:hypothetical protein